MFKLRCMEIINCMPGPVNIFDNAKEEFFRTLINHRDQEFLDLFQALKLNLKRLTRTAATHEVIITSGSGTLANQIMLGEVKKLETKGVIISNGEFGDRLIKMGRQLDLDFTDIRFPKYKEIDIDILSLYLESNIVDWAILCYNETSTSTSNKLAIELLAERGVRVFADCISVIGNELVDFSILSGASASSGKGLGSYSGLSIVFLERDFLKSVVTLKDACLFTDALTYLNSYEGVPFTLNTNLVAALKQSVDEILIDEVDHYEKVRSISRDILDNLSGIEIYGTLPYILNIKKDIGLQLQEKNVFTNWKSNYLVKEKTIQVCLMGDVDKINKQELIRALNETEE